MLTRGYVEEELLRQLGGDWSTESVTLCWKPLRHHRNFMSIVDWVLKLQAEAMVEGARVERQSPFGDWSEADRCLAHAQDLIDQMMANNEDSHGLLRSAKDNVMRARGDLDADLK